MELECGEPERECVMSGKVISLCVRCADMCSRIQRCFAHEEEVCTAKPTAMAVPETADEISHHEEYEDDVIVEIEGGVQELGASACKVCQLIGKAIRANEVPFAPEMKTLLFRWSRPVIGAWGSFTYRDEVRGDRWQGSSNFKSIFGAGHSFYTQSPPLVSNFDLVKGWIRHCTESHHHCEPEQTRPLRDLTVIDCIQRSVVPAPKECLYVALSYAWGEASKIALQEISDLSTELPATIEDSITVTKRLGYQYLWVDRYCVQQNSTEKHLQIQQMDVIYASAQITLIAAAGEDCTYGLPGVGEKRERKFASQSITIDSITLNLNLRPSGLVIAESVWFTRAWTLQEGYLAKRRLYFTDYNMLFVCSKFKEVDNNTTGISPRLDLLRSSLPYRDDSGISMGMHLLENYSKRRLSFQSDALNAILGILKSLRIGSNRVGSIWGIPFGNNADFHEEADTRLCLNWCIFSTESRRRHGFPSWSPLGWEGEVYFFDFQPHISVSGAETIWEQCDFQYSAENASEVSHDLLLTIHIVRMSMKTQGKRQSLAFPFETDFSYIYWDSTELESKQITSALCTVVPIEQSQGVYFVCILVEPHREKYERKGISYCFVPFSEEPERWLKDKAKQTIVLV